MNLNTNFPGLKDVIVEKIEEVGDRTVLHVSLPKKKHTCPKEGTEKVPLNYFSLESVDFRFRWTLSTGRAVSLLGR